MEMTPKPNIVGTQSVDINCDMGEWETGQSSRSSAESDLALMPFISSCSIACGGHIGNEHSMRTTVCNAAKNGLRVGAHPAYPDKRHFGRRSIEIRASDLASTLNSQISSLQALAKMEGTELSFVKPHGALYNDMVRTPRLADLVIDTIKQIDPNLKLMGLAGSDLAEHCESKGIVFIAEAFADRRYNDNGELTPRSHPNAVIDNPEAATEQILSLINKGSITSISGKTISLAADTLCIHSDTEGALEQLMAITQLLRKYDISLGAAS